MPDGVDGWGPMPAPARVPGGPGAPQPYVSCPGSAPNTTCVTYNCDTTTGTWKPTIAANGTKCNDGNAHTCDNPTCNTPCFLSCFCGTTCPAGANDHCQSGVCVSNGTDSVAGVSCANNSNPPNNTSVCGSDNHCSCNSSCTSVGQKGVCPTSLFGGAQSCCGSNKCVDLMNDPLNCGACGNDCAKKRFGGGTPEGVDNCVQGICVRSAGFYCSPQAPDANTLNGLASQLNSASNITFPTLSVIGGTPCSMAVSFAGRAGTGCGGFPLYGPGKNNGIALIDVQNSNAVKLYQPSSCGNIGCISNCTSPYATPFTGVGMYYDYADINNNSDWFLAGTTTNVPGATSPNPPLPGSYAVVDEASFAAGHAFQYNSGGYSAETAAAPFYDLQYNQGVVGPGIPDQQSAFGTNGLNMYYGNWSTVWGLESDGAFSIVNVLCSSQSNPECAFTMNNVPNWPPANWPGTRITAIAYSDYECRAVGSGPVTCSSSEPNPTKMFIATGTQIWVWYPPHGTGTPVNSGGLFADLKDPNWYIPDPLNPQEGTFTGPNAGITSMTADPLYGDVYIEARDDQGYFEDFVLYVPNTYFNVAYAPTRFYNLGDMAKSLRLGSVPYRYATPGTSPSAPTEGRLVAANANCIRMTVQEGQNPTFTNLPLWP
jgi:hypothetical protein